MAAPMPEGTARRLPEGCAFLHLAMSRLVTVVSGEKCCPENPTGKSSLPGGVLFWLCERLKRHMMGGDDRGETC